VAQNIEPPGFGHRYHTKDPWAARRSRWRWSWSLIVHAHEERTRQSGMRQIDPKDYDYDGVGQRRLPEGRK
jgi:hypothetical protein